MNKKIILAIFAAVMISLASNVAVSAATGYDYGRQANKQVVATKTMRLYKVQVGANESQNRFYHDGYIFKGTRLKTSDWIMSTGGGNVVKYGNHRPSKGNFYFVFNNNQKPWYK